jgi:DNA repair protein RadC
VPTIDGGRSRVKVPEGSQSGRQMRLRGKGMPALRGTGMATCIIELAVETPVNLTESRKIVLFRAIPRRDVKPLAHDLLQRFGGFEAVLSAPVEQLMAIDGVGEAVLCELKVVEAAAHRLGKARLREKQVISSWDALISYCRATMAHRPTEHFRVFFLDRKNVLIADEEQARGTVDHVPVYPREIIKRALFLNASALILVHNHPSGDPTPSAADISMTEQIRAAADTMGIVLHDHVVIGKSAEVSFRAEGYL